MVVPPNMCAILHSSRLDQSLSLADQRLVFAPAPDLEPRAGAAISCGQLANARLGGVPHNVAAERFLLDRQEALFCLTEQRTNALPLFVLEACSDEFIVRTPNVRDGDHKVEFCEGIHGAAPQNFWRFRQKF
jgi:hypothetical protein